MEKKIVKKATEQVMKKKYECKMCEGSGIVPSEQGGESENCPQCEGSGSYNLYE